MPLQNLFLDTDSLRIGANQLYTQANAVFVGNNLHVGNSILMGVTAGNTQWPVNLYPNSTKLIISANNPLWSGFGGGAIDLRVGTAGGRVGITFSSNANFGSDGAYMYYNDSLPGYTAATGSETSVFLLGTWNDSSASPSNEDILALESAGNIFLNPGMGTSITPGGTTSWSNTQGNLWVGNNSIKYLSIHEGLQAPFTLRAPITFANSANALVFSGASNTSITLRTSPNGILSFDGGAGSLLSISNNILGQIFSVNDISGFPVIEVTANTVPSNTFIQMGQFGAKVSIGTNTTSTSRLTISSNSTVNALEIQGNVGSNVGYFKTPSGTIFSHNSSNELVLLNLGQLRFTDGNAWNYDVWGGIKYTSANNTLMLGGPGAPGFTNNAVISANIVMHNATTGNFMVANSTATNLFVGANGNVGIGNTTPGSSLVVQGAAGTLAAVSGDSSNTGMTSHQAAFQLRNRNTANNTYNNITFIGSGSIAADISVQYVDQPLSYGNMRFHTRAADGYHPRLRIDAGETYVGNSSATVAFFGANGNVGIGNSTPTNKLRVEGTASISSDLTVSGNLTVSGTTTYINTTTLNVGDNIVTLNADLGAVAPSENAGIEINRGSSANVQFIWNETSDFWALGNTNITGYANVSTSVNTALLTVGTSFIANTTGAYHTGTVNAASHTVGTAVIANSVGVTTTGYVNTGTLRVATTITANGGTGTTGQVLQSNSTGGAFWATLVSGATLVANTTDTQTFYFPMSNATSGSWTNAVVDTVITFVPSTNLLTVGGDLTVSGNISGAAANVQIVAGAFTTTFANNGVITLASSISSTNTIAAGNTTITGFANVSTSVNSALLTVGTSFIANTTGAYHTGTINATSVTVGTSFIANATGAFHTGRIKSESELSVGIDGFFISFFANSTGTTINGFANVTTSVNSAILSVGTSFIANTTGAYHTGTINAASHTVSTSFIADSTGVTTTGFANVGTTLRVGANVVLGTTTIQANGGVGTAGQVLTSGATGNAYWSTISAGASLTANSTDTQTFYIPMANATSGSWSNAVISTTKMYFVPSTGTLNATVFNSLSDENKKTNIQIIPDALNVVNNIDGVTFDFTDSGMSSAGLLAGQIEQFLPQLVSTNPNGEKSLNYNGVIGVLVEAVKTLSKEVEELKKLKV